MIRSAAWETVGTNHRTKSLSEAFKAYDLDYEVAVSPICGYNQSGDKIEIPKKVLTYRTDTLQPFGIVSDRYPVIQNSEALNFIENVIQDADMELINGGHTSWGSFYLIGQLPEMTIMNDSIRPHLIFQSSHDGSVPLKATICMLRLACQNQFARSFNESPATIKILHRGDTEAKIKTASETLSGVYGYLKTYQSEVERMSKIRITPTKFNQIVEGYFKIPDEASARTEQKILERREEMRAAYDSNDNQNLKGTMWGVINAFTDYNTHRTMKNLEARFLDSINPEGTVDNFCSYVESAVR